MNSRMTIVIASIILLVGVGIVVLIQFQNDPAKSERETITPAGVIYSHDRSIDGPQYVSDNYYLQFGERSPELIFTSSDILLETSHQYVRGLIPYVTELDDSWQIHLWNFSTKTSTEIVSIPRTGNNHRIENLLLSHDKQSLFLVTTFIQDELVESINRDEKSLDEQILTTQLYEINIKSQKTALLHERESVESFSIDGVTDNYLIASLFRPERDEAQLAFFDLQNNEFIIPGPTKSFVYSISPDGHYFTYAVTDNKMGFFQLSALSILDMDTFSNITPSALQRDPPETHDTLWFSPIWGSNSQSLFLIRADQINEKSRYSLYRLDTKNGMVERISGLPYFDDFPEIGGVFNDEFYFFDNTSEEGTRIISYPSGTMVGSLTEFVTPKIVILD